MAVVKRNIGKTATQNTGRPSRMTPKAGFTKKPRRYGCGGKLKK